MSIHVHDAVTINRSADELYSFWRQFDNLPQFMEALQSVTVMDDRRSHWVAKGPLGVKVEWDSVVTADEPGKLVSWASVEGSQVETTGTVMFEEEGPGRGCVLKVNMTYSPPGGVVGHAFAKLFGADAQTQMHSDLYKLRQIMETGEIATITGQPQGLSRSA